MNFNSFLSRNREGIQEHQKNTDIKFIIKSAEKKPDENYELRLKYEIVKEHFKNFRELWTEDEILIVYEDFKDISKKGLVKQSYITGMKLERTRKAVLWMYLHLFSEKKNLHRGKEVIKFKEIFQLV